MLTPPRQFFEEFVRHSFEEYRAEPNVEYRAKTAVTYANIMANRMWHHYKDTAHVYGVSTESQYREALTANACPDFGLLHDVAEGVKHFKLNRKTRRVTSADQTGSKLIHWRNNAGEGVKWTNDAGEEVAWRGAIVVTLDDGTTRLLFPIVEAVVAMWDKLSLL